MGIQNTEMPRILLPAHKKPRMYAVCFSMLLFRLVSIGGASKI